MSMAWAKEEPTTLLSKNTSCRASVPIPHSHCSNATSFVWSQVDLWCGLTAVRTEQGVWGVAFQSFWLTLVGVVGLERDDPRGTSVAEGDSRLDPCLLRATDTFMRVGWLLRKLLQGSMKSVVPYDSYRIDKNDHKTDFYDGVFTFTIVLWLFYDQFFHFFSKL